MNKKPNKNDLSIINFAERVRGLGASVYEEVANRFGLNELHRQLLIARGKRDAARYGKFAGRKANQHYAAVEQISIMRQRAEIDGTLFHELEKLETKWQLTTYPTLEVLVFFWVRAKRAQQPGLKAALRLREEYGVRVREIVKVFYDGAISLLGITEEETKAMLADRAASVIADYVEMLIESLPRKRASFAEPSDFREALDIVGDAVEPIPDKDLPLLPMEINVFECAGQILNQWLACRDITGLNCDILSLKSVNVLGKNVATIGFVALGLPLP